MTTHFPRFPIPAPIQRFWNVPFPGQMGPPMRPPPHPLDQQQRKENEEPEPFIPPDIDLESPEDDEDEDEDEEEVPQAIPRGPTPVHVQHRVQNQDLIPLRVYKFRPSKNGWKHEVLSGRPPTDGRARPTPHPKPPCSQLRIITWNIDMQSPRPEERLHAALRHIEEDVLACKAGAAPAPCVILLQEVRDKVVPYLLGDPWVRRWFAVTPFTKDKWPRDAVYGNLTLVARSVDVCDAHILHFGLSAMQRTALCVKVRLNYPGSQETAVLSIVNTHLESLPMGAAARPKQLDLCSRFLRLKGVEGGVIAGDMNALGKGDGTIGKDIGLRDCWRKGDMDDKGKTWGYQGQNDGGRYPPNRLDKIYYLPGMGYKVEEPGRIGMGLKVGDGREALWVSDHYGLATTLRMKERSQSS